MTALHPHQLALLTELDETHYRPALSAAHLMSGNTLMQRITKAATALGVLADIGLVRQRLHGTRCHPVWKYRRTAEGTAALLRSEVSGAADSSCVHLVPHPVKLLSEAA